MDARDGEMRHYDFKLLRMRVEDLAATLPADAPEMRFEVKRGQAGDLYCLLTAVGIGAYWELEDHARAIRARLDGRKKR